MRLPPMRCSRLDLDQAITRPCCSPPSPPPPGPAPLPQAAGLRDATEWDQIERLSMACPALPLCGLAISEVRRAGLGQGSVRGPTPACNGLVTEGGDLLVDLQQRIKKLQHGMGDKL